MNDSTTRRLTTAEQVLGCVPVGLLAGAALASFDLARSLRASRDWFTAFALAALCIAAGVLVALSGRAAIGISRRLRARAPRLPLWVPEAALCTLASIPLGRQLFSGAGVQRTWLGTAGPWIFPAVVALASALSCFLLHRVAESGPTLRRTVGLILSALAAGALLLDRTWLPYLYPYVHVLLVLAALGALALALAFAWPQLADSPTVGAIGTAASTLSLLPVVLSFPHDNGARAFLLEAQPNAERVMAALSFVVDLDRDGSSPLFAGGDCHDFDPDVSPLRAEIPANGLDDDCDGSDASEGMVRSSYGGSREPVAAVRASAAGKPTVILLVDALRADRVERAEFPNLRRLVAESIHFTNAYAPASSTQLSVPAMITGHAFPAAHDASMFERLSALGHSTALIALQPVIDLVTGTKRDEAGALYYPLLRGVQHRSLLGGEAGGRQGWSAATVRSSSKMTDAALAFLARGASLVWVHYYDLHNWFAWKDLPGEGVELYDSTLRELDREVGRFLERKDELNIVLVADHGEALGEGDVGTHTMFLWASLVRVPLAIRVPGVPPARIETPVSTTDLAPTLLDLYGAADAREARFSLLTLIGSKAPPTAQLLSIESRHIALLEGHHRLIFDLQSRAVWLYDVARDPHERDDLAKRDPARTQAMLQRLLLARAAAQAHHDAEPDEASQRTGE